MSKRRFATWTSYFGSEKRLLLVLLWLTLQALDILTTALGLRSGLTEGNWFAAGILQSHGEFGMYGLKLLITAIVLGCILLLQRRYARLWVALKVVTIYMSLVVASNVVNIALEY